MKKTFLMCRPDYYQVDWVINPWMENSVGKVNPELAMEQWTKFHDELSKYVKIDLIDQRPDLSDMVFTANAGHVMSGKIYLSNFKEPERYPEIDHFEKWFLKNGYTTVRQEGLPFEGSGDIVQTGTFTFIGYGFRTSAFIEDVLPYGSDFLMSLKDPRFYHLDTCLCELGKSHIMYYPGAFADHSLEDLRDAPYIEQLEVTEEEALQFGCNAVVIDKTVFMPKCPSLAEKLSKIGFDVKQFDMSEFIKSGGATRCLCLDISNAK